ncbi:hypothetical protein GCM10029978_103790 [Actinoallomurus acanthiterrae]
MPERYKLATLHIAERTDLAAFSPDGKTLACGGGEPNYFTMQLWDVATRTRKRTYAIRSRQGDSGNRVVALNFDPASRPLAIDERDEVWDIAVGERVTSLRIAGMSGLSTAGVSPDGHTIVAASWGGIQFVDMSTGAVFATSRRGDGYTSGWQVAFSQGGTLVAVSSGP